jgi:hypothetical protein
MQKVVISSHARNSSKTISSMMQRINCALGRIGRRLFVAPPHQRIPATFAQMASPLLMTVFHIMMGRLASKTLTLPS